DAVCACSRDSVGIVDDSITGDPDTGSDARDGAGIRGQINISCTDASGGCARSKDLTGITDVDIADSEAEETLDRRAALVVQIGQTIRDAGSIGTRDGAKIGKC